MQFPAGSKVADVVWAPGAFERHLVPSGSARPKAAPNVKFEAAMNRMAADSNRHEKQWIFISVVTSLLLGILLGETAYFLSTSGVGMDAVRSERPGVEQDQPPHTVEFPEMDSPSTPDTSDTSDTSDTPGAHATAATPGSTELVADGSPPDTPDDSEETDDDTASSSGATTAATTAPVTASWATQARIKPTRPATRTRRPVQLSPTAATPSTSAATTTATPATLPPIPANLRQKRIYEVKNPGKHPASTI